MSVSSPPQSPTGTIPPPKAGILRRQSASKMILIEKIVQIYESIFQGHDPWRENPNFWNEMFLLKVNAQFIEKEFEKMTGEQLVALKENINTIFYHCILTLKEEDYPIRIVNALQTICTFIRGIYQKSLRDCGFDIINVLIGFDTAEQEMQTLIETLHKLLTGEGSVTIKSLTLKLLLVLVTATDNISQNTMLEYLMLNSIFEAVVQIIETPSLRVVHGHDAVLLLTLLVQYRKYESVNPYIVKLSILDQELALNGFAWVVSSTLTGFNREYQRRNTPQQTSFFSSFTSMVGNMFVAEEGTVEAIKANASMLLALYEAIHLNRNFITTLTHSHTPTSPATPPESPTLKTLPAVEGAEVPESSSQPTNLLVTFLEYCSIVMQDIKDNDKHNNARLCFIILTIIAEDQYANSLMHDVNMNFRVPLHKMPMRHRKPSVDKTPASRPLACALLDLMVEFIISHMMKNMPLEIYVKCLDIIHRVLCYQKKCRVRLQYHWKDLWTALINLLKFLLASESIFMKKQQNVFPICTKIVNIFNLFITYGDTFLPSPTSYDELYYELIRMHQVFDNLYSMGLRYSTTNESYRETAVRLTNCLVNVRAIINHFTPKIDSWASANHLSSLTEEQVLEVVRNNYDTLTLKLQDSLDQYERYTEKSKEASFFTNLVRSIVSEVRKTVSAANLQQQSALQLSAVK